MRLTACLLFASFAALLFAGEVRGAVDESPLPFKTVRAFPELRFDRPIVVASPQDGTNRLFVAGQKGQIHVFPNDQSVEEAALFFDITSKVVYKEKENEEGLLGLAFHPNYKKRRVLHLLHHDRRRAHLGDFAVPRVEGRSQQSRRRL